MLSFQLFYGGCEESYDCKKLNLYKHLVLGFILHEAQKSI